MKITDGMLQKLDKIEARYGEVGEMLGDPQVIANQKEYKALSKEHSDLTPIVEIYARYKKHKSEFCDCEEMISLETNLDMKAMFKQELDELRDAIDKDGQDLKIAMLPKDPNENNNVIMEIRAGAGGDEAALFGTELMKMYRHYADLNHWKVEEVNMNYTELGGAKELVFMITGNGVYGKLKFESGVHRVQRVPETESQGRVHTSTVTVAVLPEAEDVEVNINENDIKVDTYRSGGAGGQHVNKTESAIRITHIPTGIIVACQNERSQIQNREMAMQMLRSKLIERREREREEEAAQISGQLKKIEWGSQIRSYVFCPYTMVKDHRTNYETGNVQAVMDGDLDGFINEYLKLSSIQK